MYRVFRLTCLVVGLSACAGQDPAKTSDVADDTGASDVLDTSANDIPLADIADTGESDLSDTDPVETSDATSDTSDTGSPLPGIEWVAVQGIEVGVVSVPYDYAAPDGPRFDLRVARVTHTGPTYKGVILANFGGPGAPGEAYLAFFAEVFAEALVHYDLVTWNPRGTFGSDQLGCADDFTEWNAMLDLYDGSLEASSMQALVAAMTDVIDACRASNPELVDHMGYVSWADDIESIRVALGVEKLSYFGGSAGTSLGAAYAQRYPDRVDRFVLDSSVSPYGGLETLLRGQANAVDGLVTEWSDWCGAAASCAVKDDPIGSLQEVSDQAMERPLRLFGTSLTYGRMAFGSFLSLYNDDDWGKLAGHLKDALSGNPQGLLVSAMTYFSYTNSGIDPASMIVNLTLCSDSDWRPTPEELARETTAQEAVNGTGGGLSRLLWLDNLWCTALGPMANAVPELQGVEAPPMLMLQSRFDVATPLAGAQKLQAELANQSPMVVLAGAEHVAVFSSDCMLDHAISFYVDGVLPADGATCE